MGLQGYVGSAEDQARIRRLEREREEERQRVEEARKASASQPAGFRKWKQGTVAATEIAFKQETIGLVSRDEYIERKATIQARLEAEEKKRKRDQESEQQQTLAEAQARKERERKCAKLSFAEEDDLDVDDIKDWGVAHLRLRKNADVPTDFLPDMERERAMEDAKHLLKERWLDEQQKLKEQDLCIKYSYWDGSGHQRKLTVKAGDTVTEFLNRARVQLAADFPQMRHVTVMNLLLVKDDLVLPHALTFYTLIVGKACNSSGEVLFDPSVPVNKQGAHSAKVVHRHWYESSKHIFPMNKWVPFDEDKHVKQN